MDKIYDFIEHFIPTGLMPVWRKFRKIAPGWTIIHFGLSSCGCIVIDKAAFTLAVIPLEGAIGRSVAVVISGLIARLVSGNINYLYNQRAVFKAHPSIKSYVQYWGLCAITLSLSITATTILVHLADVHGAWITLVNFLVDVCLFLFSYCMQKFFIFKKREVK